MVPDSNRSHILIVDDDERLRSLLQRYLVRNGYWCTCAKHADHALNLLKFMQFDLIVMDVMMPEMDGITLTSRIRQSTAIPIIVLSAKTEVESRVTGLRAGADDYVQKPYEPVELLLRIEAVLRRANSPETQSAAQILPLGRFQFDTVRGELRDGDLVVHLTEFERKLMLRLSETPNRVVKRSEFSEAGSEVSALGRAVDVRVSRLRQKFENDPRRPRYLVTVRSEGYMLVPH